MISILLGGGLGLLSGTVSESLGHRIFGHPSTAQLNLYNRYPRFFAAPLKAYYHHFVIHHQKTFQKDLLTQFDGIEHKNKIDDWIKSSFSEDFAKLIWVEKYNLTLVGIQGILPFAIPFLAGPILIWLALGDLAFFASLLPAFVPVYLSKNLHPYIHQPQNLSKAPLLIRAIAGTPYMRWVVRNHDLHHKHPDWNFNLLLGGDRIVGAHLNPTKQEEVEFESLWKRYESSWGT